MRATRPSIMSLGATTSAPARACTSAISASTSMVASLSTSCSPSRRVRRMPQCPWSVYSSTHTSVITTRSGRRALHLGHGARHRAVGIEAARAARVFRLGEAEQDDRADARDGSPPWPRPARPSRGAARPRASSRWGTGESMAALKKRGQTNWRGVSVVSRTRARRAGVARSRRGRMVGKAIVTAVG